jgi:phosphatidylserine/phosphatidylglycerophosphate/cardiolipin synthase-like enzyme
VSDTDFASAHNKVMVIDGDTVITGSFNFTAAAEKSNAENLLIVAGKHALAEGYEKNFSEHLGHSEKFRR